MNELDYSKYIGKGLEERDDNSGKWKYVGRVTGYDAQFLITSEGNYVDAGCLEETVIANNFKLPPRVRITSQTKFTLSLRFPFVHYEYKQVEKKSKSQFSARRKQ